MQNWNSFVQQLLDLLGKAPVKRWLEGVKIAKFDAQNIYLSVRDSFQIHWFSEHIEPLARRHFCSAGRPIRIHLALRDQTPSTSTTHPHKGAPTTRSSSRSHLSFEDFYPTRGQRLAHLLVGEITASGGDSRPSLGTYNPIFLYGPSGSGKSHLLSAVADRLKALDKQVVYLDGDAFTEDVVSAIRRGEMRDFRRRYRRADALIVDSVEKLGKKSATQEEFFHTFNTLHTAGKQILLSAPQHPQALNFIEQRLISRFEWGLSVELEGVSAEEALSILRIRAEKLGLDISQRDLQCLIAKLDVNLKKLVEALETLAYKIDLKRSFATGQRAVEISIWEDLKEILQRHQIEKTTPQIIIEQVAAHFGILSTDILGRSQNREFTRPRRLAMYLCRHELRLPFVKIGEIFSRDHSTVISNCRNIEQSLSLQRSVPDLHEVSQRLRATQL